MKLTEEETRELLENIIQIVLPPNNIDIEATIKYWKYDKGWIEKNAVDEFIECYYQFKETGKSSINSAYYDDDSPAVKLAKAGMKAIEELQEKYENKKEE